MDNIKDKNGLTEKEFLEAYKKKNYPRPYLTADIVVIGKCIDTNKLLLIRRGGHPYINMLALPGGFSRQTETMEQTAHRELLEETGVSSTHIRPIGLFSKPDRDPRGWVVTQAYLAEVNFSECKAKAGDDAKDAEWFDLSYENKTVTLADGNTIISFAVKDGKTEYLTEERLAFDHAEIISEAVEML